MTLDVRHSMGFRSYASDLGSRGAALPASEHVLRDPRRCHVTHEATLSCVARPAIQRVSLHGDPVRGEKILLRGHDIL